jgi:hypothetical protein
MVNIEIIIMMRGIKQSKNDQKLCKKFTKKLHKKVKIAMIRGKCRTTKSNIDIILRIYER